MPFTLPLFSIPLWAVLLSLSSGCQPPASPEAQHKQHPNTEADDVHDHSSHDHGYVEVTSFGADTPVPTITLKVTPDSVSGWNIYVDTTQFQFTPEHIDQANKANTGHGHLYVDGYKFGRLYGPWYHLKALTPGEHKIEVQLNANDHSVWSHNGNPISAAQHVVQP